MIIGAARPARVERTDPETSEVVDRIRLNPIKPDH